MFLNRIPHALLCVIAITVVTGTTSSCNKAATPPAKQETDLSEKVAKLNQRLAALENDPQLSANNNVVTEYLKKSEARNTRIVCVQNLRKVNYALLNWKFRDKKIMPGHPLNWNDLMFALKTVPRCPLGDDYQLLDKVPHSGTSAVTCPHAKKLGHHPYEYPQL